MWTHFLQTCTYAYNGFARSALNGLSLFQLNFEGLTKGVLEIGKQPSRRHKWILQKYYELHRQRCAYFSNILQKYRFKHLDMGNKNKPMTQYKPRN